MSGSRRTTGHASTRSGNRPGRGHRPGLLVDTLAQDLRYGFRQIVRRPGFYVLAATVIVMGVTFAATLVPVTRAMRVDPVEALRAE